MKSWVVKNEALGFPFESSIDIKKIQWLSKKKIFFFWTGLKKPKMRIKKKKTKKNLFLSF